MKEKYLACVSRAVVAQNLHQVSDLVTISNMRTSIKSYAKQIRRWLIDCLANCTIFYNGSNLTLLLFKLGCIKNDYIDPIPLSVACVVRCTQIPKQIT